MTEPRRFQRLGTVVWSKEQNLAEMKATNEVKPTPSAKPNVIPISFTTSSPFFINQGGP